MQRSKSNELNREVDKASELLGEALLNAIRLAVREEIREALSQGGFSFDDRLLHTEEASKVLQVSPDCLYRNSRKLPFTRRLGPKALRFSSGKETNASPELRIRLVDASGFKVPYLGSRVCRWPSRVCLLDNAAYEHEIRSRRIS
jgi:predicted DNA-binding transcriptional regulator AlpA